MNAMTRDYTPDELLRGRFLRHFMGLEQSEQDDDATLEEVAVPADYDLPKTRETPRPERLRPSHE